MAKHPPTLYFLLLVCASLVASHNPKLLDKEWTEWKSSHKRVYSSIGEERSKRAIWELNYEIVKSHNKRPNVTFTMEMNHFADQLHKKKKLEIDSSQDSFHSLPDVIAPPTHFDWRDKHDVTPVKNQGQIGAVEAFVAAECVESYHAIHNGTLQDLSVEEVNDCCRVAGLPIAPDVFGCIHQHGGLCTPDTYHGKGNCGNNTCTAAAKDVTKTVFIKSGDEDGMANAVLLVPLMVYVDASHTSFQLYTSGIYQDPDCSKTQVDHSLQIVGYGVDKQGTKYWICRNSWGASWGMKGYINILRGENMCGIATTAKFPA